jgi:hypothetical protein
MHLVILVWPTRVRMEARHKAATAIELPKEGRTVPSGRTRTAGDSAPFLSHHILQNGPRRQGSATPRKTSAPWTAPGRSTDSTGMKEREPLNFALDLLWRLPLVGDGPDWAGILD